MESYSLDWSETIRMTLSPKLNQDPELPRLKPTESFWQLPPHPSLSAIKSEALPSVTDFAIIGSGITGCSVAKNILDNTLSGNASVTIFEARTITSGASGRNGGHLASPGPYDFSGIAAVYGHDMAVKIARFYDRTLEEMHTLAENVASQGDETDETRRVQSVVGYRDQETYDAAVQSLKEYIEAVPEHRDSIHIINGKEAEKLYNLKNVAGASLTLAGAFWPYRLITAVFASILDKYQPRFTVETSTPITSIQYDPANTPTHPYILSTPRGVVRAAKVIHCTNGHSGYLVPALRGKIFPVRGTMSAQKAGSRFPIVGDKLSWSFVSTPKLDQSTGDFEVGLYYMQQNARTGDIFIGGEKQKLHEIITADDTEISETAKKNITTILPKLFRKGWENEEPEPLKVWSGILGFTADRIPLVGKLPQKITQRGPEGGEWIAAGFNGHGVPQCWSCGEAVARMILGEATPDWLPDVYLVSEERLLDEERMGTEAAIRSLIWV